MTYTIEKKEKKLFIGLPVRTSNARFLNDVPPIWAKFNSEKLESKIPNRSAHNLLVVYTEYEGDYTQPYTYLIGSEVSSKNQIPPEMRVIEIPKATYAVFTARGAFPNSLITTWQMIWRTPLPRLYTADFELYPPDYNPKANPEVKVYIAIKDAS